MSDEQPAQQPKPVRIYKLGPWPQREQVPDNATELGARCMAWLRGESIPVDADMSRILLREFGAQERYRLAVTQYLNAIRMQVEQAQLEAEACEGQPATLGEHWAYGYSSGQRDELRATAQLIQDVINGACLAVGDPEPVAP
jgi:hypothetical protein